MFSVTFLLWSPQMYIFIKLLNIIKGKFFNDFRYLFYILCINGQCIFRNCIWASITYTGRPCSKRVKILFLVILIFAQLKNSLFPIVPILYKYKIMFCIPTYLRYETLTELYLCALKMILPNYYVERRLPISIYTVY